MADDERRGFLKTQLGAGTAFAAGLLAGGAAGASGARVYIKAQQNPFAEVAKLSYAQQGEDIVLANILSRLGLSQLVYLDVGAHHPVVNNNTFLLYERGHRGVLVEPNPSLWSALSQARPDDVLIRGGIGIDGADTEADYYVMHGDGQINTFSKEMVDKYAAIAGGNPVKEVIRLPLLDINGLMQKQWGGAPHLLSVDTEGFELPILRSLNWKRYRPAVVCVDTLEFGSRKQRLPILRFMAAQGYAVRGATFVNTIYVDQQYL